MAQSPSATQCGAEPPSSEFPWPDFATPAVVQFLTGEERKPLRAACRAGRGAVDAGITGLRLETLRVWGDDRGDWMPAEGEPPRLPSLTHLSLRVYERGAWAQHAAAHVRGAARLVAAHAPALRSLTLAVPLGSSPKSLPETRDAEGALLESVLLAAPLPALRRLRMAVWGVSKSVDVGLLEAALSPVARLSLPALHHLELQCDWPGAAAATERLVRWAERAELPALRCLAVHAHPRSTHLTQALAAPRWGALRTLELRRCPSDGGVDAWTPLAAALAPALRHLAIDGWPRLVGEDGAGVPGAWLELRSLEVGVSFRDCRLVLGRPGEGALALALAGARFPRLRALAVLGCSPQSALQDLCACACAPAMPSLRLLALEDSLCGRFACALRACGHAPAAPRLAALRAAWPGLEVRDVAAGGWDLVGENAAAPASEGEAGRQGARRASSAAGARRGRAGWFSD